MPLEKVKELIDDVDILGCEQISFSGGEPFLHKDLVNAARKSKVDDNTARMQSIKQLGV